MDGENFNPTFSLDVEVLNDVRIQQIEKKMEQLKLYLACNYLFICVLAVMGAFGTLLGMGRQAQHICSFVGFCFAYICLTGLNEMK